MQDTAQGQRCARRALRLRGAACCAVFALYLVAAFTVNDGSYASAMGADDMPVEFVWWESHPTAVISSALEIAGYEPQQAVELTASWFETWLSPAIDDLDNPAAHQAVMELWAAENVSIAMVDAFLVAGHEPQSAVDGAVEAIEELDILRLRAGDEPVSAWETESDPCVAYATRIVYCEVVDGSIRKRTRRVWFEGACWESIRACEEIVCDISDIPFYELTLALDCPGVDDETCVAVGEERVGGVEVPCTWIESDCLCVDGADPLPDCGEIKAACGDPKLGPPGCPDC